MKGKIPFQGFLLDRSIGQVYIKNLAGISTSKDTHLDSFIRWRIKTSSGGQGNDARIVPFDSPFVPRLSKDERRLRTGLGNDLHLKKFTVTLTPACRQAWAS